MFITLYLMKKIILEVYAHVNEYEAVILIP